ncbi:hypothetical protein LENED_012125 [Lentinula edodes]|uniref:Uncharacterized protein n=1 Tax=Lentinula edodes TaxID=5353 RepID=A0A1Q3ERW5_LENED|nr:hypothetical protein HHX47_DHR7000051 [Lentinula edodes]GAW09912.1 hypothetical protein LENED_012125 [Lentinula edodes]
MVGEKDGKKYGVLNDWDLAISLDKQEETPTLHYRTGTRPYMALEQHSSSSPSPSEECEQDSDDDDAVNYCHWIDYGNRFLHREKMFIIALPSWVLSMANRITNMLEPWLPWVLAPPKRRNGRSEAAKNRERKRKKGKSQGEEWQPQPQQVLSIFDEDTLGGHFSYKNMVFIMHQFCGKELETRSVEWQEMVQKQTQQLQTERTGTDGMAQDG